MSERTEADQGLFLTLGERAGRLEITVDIICRGEEAAEASPKMLHLGGRDVAIRFSGDFPECYRCPNGGFTCPPIPCDPVMAEDPFDRFEGFFIPLSISGDDLDLPIPRASWIQKARA